MKTKINCQIKNLYRCTFTSDKHPIPIYVVSDSFGRAASIAHSNASRWENYESFELTEITLCYPVVTA